MQFLKKLKSREMLEMGLKSIMYVIIGIILIILMEGMIYSIYMDKIRENTEKYKIAESSVLYCHEIAEDEYEIFVHNVDIGSWAIRATTATKAEIESEEGFKDIIYRKPNAFDVSITGTHYIVMTVFIVGILGFSGWSFYKLNREYIGFEKKLKKTGKIF